MSYRVVRKQPEEQKVEAPVVADKTVPEKQEEVVQEPVAEPKRHLVPEFITIGDFKIRYVQPEPVPDFILFLQQLQHKDVKFVKIPVSAKEDKLYLHKPIMQLLGLTGVHWDKIENLIKRYNDLDLGKTERDRVRDALLAIVNLTIFICDEERIEFLRETN